MMWRGTIERLKATHCATLNVDVRDCDVTFTDICSALNIENNKTFQIVVKMSLTTYNVVINYSFPYKIPDIPITDFIQANAYHFINLK